MSNGSTTKMQTVLIPSGANLRSVQFALERLGANVEISTDWQTIHKADRVILPGVGHAHQAKAFLQQCGLWDRLPELRQPTLGLCLGMQLLFESTAEGEVEGLGLVTGRLEHFDVEHLRVPHMGWNQVESKAAWLPSGDYYFVHSYFAPVGRHTVGKTIHGQAFTAAVQKENFYGCQFHPERSGALGAELLRNFMEVI